ncbi:MAG: dihydroneopterin aldolase [Alphaproteobacteria bacterium]
MTTAGTPLAPAKTVDATAAQSAPPTYRIFVRDLVIPWEIGIYDHEHDALQRVRINIDLIVLEADKFDADRYRQVVCYAEVVKRVQQLAREGRINLVETLASRVADLCLSDNRVERVTVRAEKLDAIAEVSSVGIEIERSRAGPREGPVRIVRD